MSARRPVYNSPQQEAQAHLTAYRAVRMGNYTNPAIPRAQRLADFREDLAEEIATQRRTLARLVPHSPRRPFYTEYIRLLSTVANRFNALPQGVRNGATLQQVRNNNAANAAANVPTIPMPNNLKDPVSLKNKNNWGSNRAVEVNTGHRKNYFNVSTFNRIFGRGWRNMNPNSNNSIHNTKLHPITRGVIKRKMVRLVKFAPAA